MAFAEDYARPTLGTLAEEFPRNNDFAEVFYLRWGRIEFDAQWGPELNIKVLLKVYRAEAVEQYVLDTEQVGDAQWNFHRRATRDFFIHTQSQHLGHAHCVKFAFIAHVGEHSIPSEHEYIFMDALQLMENANHHRAITTEWATPNAYRTYEAPAQQLQNDTNWYNAHFDDLRLIPKFTKGQHYHPFHPKRFIHDHIDKVIALKQQNPNVPQYIKVCVDCIDDGDFINHLIHAHEQGVVVQCSVDWRKMTLTNSPNYARLKLAGIELLGIVCMPKHHLIEVAPDMHNKFIIFGEEDCIVGSFNITFDRWWANWESGMTFHSQGVCRLLDNIFQSVRGGVIQGYTVDPLSHFNLLYTFGRHATPNGKPYLPHHAIISEIRRAQKSIRLCLFLMGDMLGEHGESVVDTLIEAHHRGVLVQIIFNGHLARVGDPGEEITFQEEIRRPLLPAVARLRGAGVPVMLAYGTTDHKVPYSPLHSKYCVIDDYIVLDGSFNWYNTSVFSHDLLVIAANRQVAEPYLYEFNEIMRTFRLV